MTLLLPSRCGVQDERHSVMVCKQYTSMLMYRRAYARLSMSMHGACSSCTDVVYVAIATYTTSVQLLQVHAARQQHTCYCRAVCSIVLSYAKHVVKVTSIASTSLRVTDALSVSTGW